MIVKYNNKVVSNNGKWVGYNGSPTPSLQPYTLRLRFRSGVTPTFSKGTATLVDSTNNIWDLTYENSNWTNLLRGQGNLLEVLGGNTTGVTNMEWTFFSCSSLTSVHLFDTSTVIYMSRMFNQCSSLNSVPLFNTANVTYMSGMFSECYSLTSIPLFDTSNVTNMDSMFYGCVYVQSGALALYQQASSQANPPLEHSNTFIACGSNTQTGAAELAQIPTSWGGTMQE